MKQYSLIIINGPFTERINNMFIKKLLVILLVAAPAYHTVNAKPTKENTVFAGALVLFIGFVAYKYYTQQSKEQIALQKDKKAAGQQLFTPPSKKIESKEDEAVNRFLARIDLEKRIKREEKEQKEKAEMRATIATLEQRVRGGEKLKDVILALNPGISEEGLGDLLFKIKKECESCKTVSAGERMQRDFVSKKLDEILNFLRIPLYA